MIATVNPATGDCLATFDTLTESQLDEKLARGAAAFVTYRRTTFAERAGWMNRAAEILEAEKDAFARIMTLEMGKPLESARQEAAKCATACRYYVEHAERLLADELVDTGGPMSFIRYQPIGAVLSATSSIQRSVSMPLKLCQPMMNWTNFPVIQVAGNDMCSHWAGVEVIASTWVPSTVAVSVCCA